MKKILLVILCCLMLTCGCSKKKLVETVTFVSEDEAKEVLFEVGNKVYEKKQYKDYTKEKGKYFISLNDLKDKYGYDVSVFDRVEGKVCDYNLSGVYIDEDNKEKISYASAPVMISVVCN